MTDETAKDAAKDAATASSAEAEKKETEDTADGDAAMKEEEMPEKADEKEVASTDGEKVKKEEEKSEMEVPLDKIGAIIGVGGAEMTKIRSESGANVETPPWDEQKKLSAAGKTTIAVSLKGTPDAIAKAKELIRAAIERPRGQHQKQTVVLAGHKFHSPEELRKHCEKVIEGLTEDEPLSGSAAYFMYALLSNHFKADEKCGDGLAAIKYGVNKDFPDTKCFVAVREDDSENSFSYKKCIDAVFVNAREGQRERGMKRERDDMGGGGGRDGHVAKSQRTEFTPGLVVVADGVAESADFRGLKDTFGDFGAVRYVEIHDNRAYVRFADTDGAKAAVNAGQTDVEGDPVTMELLEGDNEKSYWERLWASQERRAARENGGGRGGRGRGGRGWRRGGRGRGGGRRSRY
mmetsp:Transcript_31464/g.94135  ORF Transcript_31464/g.94135 Transcript_31464/m.94135 type:complete len:406 (-) Transcript_31464:335-1552(-)